MASKKTKRAKAVRRSTAKKTSQKRAPVVRKSPSPAKSKKSTKSPTSKKSKRAAPKKAAPKKSAPRKRAPARRPDALPVARPSPVIPQRRENEDAALYASAQSFPESRYFTSAHALMGYLEGRPGIVCFNAVIPSRGGERVTSGWTDAQRREMGERLDATPPAQDAAELPEYRAWRRIVMEALEWADDGGVVVEAEVDSDSEPSET